jgi:hypothetical protein
VAAASNCSTGALGYCGVIERNFDDVVMCSRWGSGAEREGLGGVLIGGLAWARG